MKPTEQQIKNLQGYLQEALSYRETYEEVYDHVLTALENQPAGISYEDNINNIINKDFGGAKNLVRIEKGTKSALVSESVDRYWAFFTAYFKLPKIIYTFIAALLTYYFLLHVTLSVIVFESTLVLLMLVVPGCIALMRLFSTGYFLDTTRKSARDKMFVNFAGGPGKLLMALNLWVFKTMPFGVWFNSQHLAMTAIYLLCTIYCLSMYKLYRHEFRAAFAQ